MEHLYVWLALPVILLTAWFYTAAVAQSRFPILRNKAIVLLIAHPDDEAMFFSPTVLSLTRPDLGNHLKILCLSSGISIPARDQGLISSGNAENKGATRKKEIVASAKILGLRSDSCVHVIDDPDFPDSMREHWDSGKVAQLLDAFFVKDDKRRRNAREDSSNVKPPSITIDVLITFDATGISGHPNHRSLYTGAVQWIQELTKGQRGEPPVRLYRLESTNVVRKYAGLLDVPFTLIKAVLDSLAGAGKKGEKEYPRRLVFLSDWGNYRKAQRAMTQAHKSQMVWFRWGWITLSRYMVVNDLKREYVSGK